MPPRQRLGGIPCTFGVTKLSDPVTDHAKSAKMTDHRRGGRQFAHTLRTFETREECPAARQPDRINVKTDAMVEYVRNKIIGVVGCAQGLERPRPNGVVETLINVDYASCMFLLIVTSQIARTSALISTEFKIRICKIKSKLDFDWRF